MFIFITLDWVAFELEASTVSDGVLIRSLNLNGKGRMLRLNAMVEKRDESSGLVRTFTS